LLESVTFMQSMSRPYIENKWDEWRIETVAWIAELRDSKYSHESHGNQNQVWLCQRGPAAIYLTEQPITGCETKKKYGHESCGAQTQEWLCWRRPTVIFQTRRNQVISHRCKNPRVMRQKNMVVSPTKPRTKDDCAGKHQQQITQPNQVGRRESGVSTRSWWCAQK
jgi:hypothetical protein